MKTHHNRFMYHNQHIMALEVELQGDGPLDLVNMLIAYDYVAFRVNAGVNLFENKQASEYMVRSLAHLVKPEVNTPVIAEYRNVPVKIRGIVEGVKPDLVPDAMGKYLSALVGKSPILRDDPKLAYMEFQKIHPFKDGNGRVGFFIYNILNGTINELELPPKFDPTYTAYTPRGKQPWKI